MSKRAKHTRDTIKDLRVLLTALRDHTVRIRGRQWRRTGRRRRHRHRIGRKRGERGGGLVEIQVQGPGLALERSPCTAIDGIADALMRLRQRLAVVVKGQCSRETLDGVRGRPVVKVVRTRRAVQQLAGIAPKTHRVVQVICHFFLFAFLPLLGEFLPIWPSTGGMGHLVGIK